MNKKFITVAVILCLLSLGNYAFGTSAMDTEIPAWHAYQDDWVGNSNGGTTTDWNDPCNWALVAHPSEGPGTIFPIDSRVWACIEPKTPGPNVTGDVCCVRLSIHPWSWDYAPAPFVMTIANTAGEVNCGVMIGLADKAYYVSPTQGYPVLDVNGGHIFTPGIPNVTDWNTNPPTIDPVKPWWDGEGLWVGGSCPSAGGGVGNGTGANYGIVNVNGGMIDVPAIKLYYGDINIYGGLVYHNVSNTSSFFISQNRTMNKINVAGGELRLKGNRIDQVNYYLSKGRLIPCDGHGDLNIDYNGFDTSVTATCTPDSAWNPNPIDGAVSVPLNKLLTWSAGPKTATVGDSNAHYVYFGPNEANVFNATPGNPLGAYKGAQDACSYNPGMLVMDTNYFWRIDEHNDVTVWKGNIWAFKSKGPQATDPIPVDNATGLPLPIALKWSAGAKAQAANGHRVYFGDSEVDVTDSTAGNVLPGVTMTVVSSTICTIANLGATLYSDVDYYWRVDEINDLDANSPWKGETWHVLNTNYYIAEDFDLYTDNATMYAKWKMGSTNYLPCPLGFGNSNGVIDYDMNDGDNKHMQYDYDDSYGESFSEVRFDANDGNASGSDWTGGGALPGNNKCRSLAIGFIGNVNNAANGDYDRMYAAIEDTSGNFGMVTNSNSQAQRSFGWTQWYIDLNDFNDTTSVNLGHIRYLYLGFGGKCLSNAPGLGGTGRVRFDDFRLYQKTCLPQFLPVGDLSGDCKVDYTDLDVMANTWAVKQTILPSVTNPGTTGLRLWYKFDETTGTTITDSSGNGYNGEVNCTPTFADSPLGLPTTILWDPTGGYDGNGCFVSSPVVIRDYNMMIDAGKGALSPTQTSITFSIWINGDTYMPLSGWARLISVFQDMNTGANDENEVIEIDCPIPRTGNCGVMSSIGVKGDGNSVINWSLPLSAFAGSWQHYAFVRSGADGNGSDPNKLRIYHNGELIVDANALRPIFGSTTPYDGTLGIENFRLTSMNFGAESYYGKIDDFRVYNRALSAAEIGWLGTKGTGNVPFSNASNLKVTSPDKISFNDMAMLAKNWLVFQSWPNP